MKRCTIVAFVALVGCGLIRERPEQVPPSAPSPSKATVVTLDGEWPMVDIKIMVKAGSTADPVGKEGLASLVARAVIDGGFGEPAAPMTKERLAAIVQPWGEGAMPVAHVASDTTTFHFTVPKEVLSEYLERVLRPLMTRPLFAPEELERLKSEMVAAIPIVRYEDLETLGLAAIDEYVFEGTRYEHQPFGTEESIPRLTRDDAVGFYHTYYQPGNIILGISVEHVAWQVRQVVESLGQTEAPAPPAREPAPFEGRHAIVIEEPNAPAASVHLAFPLAVDRSHPDFWPLWVANTWLGTHRDSFGRLYQAIREERGYNYGDYSYIEHWDGRTGSLFQIFNQPRRKQYFSIWVRPVQHEYACHLLKAVTFELERLIRDGLTAEQVAAAKNKAKVLYLNLGETVERLLAARMDSAFYNMSPGFLDGYLERIEAVTAAEVNAALKKHLQVENVKYLVVTDSKHAKDLAAQLQSGGPAYGKGLKEYQLETVTLPDGTSAWQVPDSKVEMLRLDALWANYPLRIASVRLAPVTAMFRTGKHIAPALP